MDFLTPEKRSARMSRIRSSDTLPERLLRSCLHSKGWRFRKNVRGLPGTPDIVFSSLRVIVFIDGDFWHGYRFADWQAKLSDYWREKIERNMRHDRRNARTLRGAGWTVVRIWEHDIMRDIERAVHVLDSRRSRTGRMSSATTGSGWRLRSDSSRPAQPSVCLHSTAKRPCEPTPTRRLSEQP